MSQIKLNDLLGFTEEEMNHVKIKFNQSNGFVDPMEVFKQSPEEVNTQWLFWRNKSRYFNVGQTAVCLLKLSYDTWLLTTIKKVTKELDVLEGINYEGVELPQYEKYYGRVIIKFKKSFMAQGRFYKDLHQELIVQQILPTIYDGDDFPGYDKVKLSYQQLATIIHRGKRDWIAALENQKAVYLITDKSNGRLYVGSATSMSKMLLTRWSNYVANGHGGNKELVALVEEKGFDYVKENFQYTILENYNGKVDDKLVLQRESYWKEALQSRQFGYNSN
ncbi:GIY-YIG nuclease family protein [Macrococcoides caseolyticum]|uniref:GIY-YIG nuclease family protein n=1 Tax=Macrococcoides caseolyticum TaxID=69966 RepID=UPI001F2B86B4|nr:GIY-YIG nuclease family protein [Macrococcus caseolyticus]MCE4956666.1 GIY-YIG nuclease family protein [Macrococcus caseolyticus]